MKLKSKLTRQLFLLLAAISVSAIKTQAQIVSYASGRTVNETEYASVTGSPYLFEEWLSGSASFTTGKITGLTLKYNAKDDELYFKNEKGEAMAFAKPVDGFTLTQNNLVHSFRSGYPDGSGVTSKSFLEVVADGKTQFLKKQSKTITESKDYASSITNKRFLDVTKYYIFTDGKVHQVKKDNKSILAAFTNKQAELSKYVQDNKLNLKDESEIVKAITYYNTL